MQNVNSKDTVFEYRVVTEYGSRLGVFGTDPDDAMGAFRDYFPNIDIPEDFSTMEVRVFGDWYPVSHDRMIHHLFKGAE